MLILSIDNLQTLNQIAFESFSLPNSRMIPFDNACAYVIYNKDFKNFRQFVNNNQTTYDYVASLPVGKYDLNADVLSTYEVYSSSNSDQLVYFYPFGKLDFMRDYFANVLPTLANAIFDLMKSTGRIVQIGSGNGKAIVVTPSVFAEIHLSALPVVSNPKQSFEDISTALASVSSYVQNFDYLIEMISHRDQVIDSLRDQVKQLNDKVYSMYQTTWR